MIVADASAIVDLLLRIKDPARLEARILAPAESLHAPHLLDVEVAHALRRQARWGEIEPQRADAALADLLRLRVERHPHTILLERAWELRRSLSIYDAMYIALAEVLDAPLVTRDRRLARAHGHRARVEVL